MIEACIVIEALPVEMSYSIVIPRLQDILFRCPSEFFPQGSSENNHLLRQTNSFQVITPSMFVSLSGMGAQTTGKIWVKLGSQGRLSTEIDIG